MIRLFVFVHFFDSLVAVVDVMFVTLFVCLICCLEARRISVSQEHRNVSDKLNGSG